MTLRPLWVVLGRSLSLCWRSWAALGAYVGGLGSLSGLKLAVLAADQGLSWRSWLLLGPLWPVLGRDQTESGPNPSGKAIWQADRSQNVAQTQAGRPLSVFWAPEP